MAGVTKSGIVTASKLRAIADRIERAAAGEVRELRRLADLLDGVAALARKPAPKRPGRKTKAARKVSAERGGKAKGKAKRRALGRSPLGRKHRASPVATRSR